MVGDGGGCSQHGGCGSGSCKYVRCNSCLLLQDMLRWGLNVGVNVCSVCHTGMRQLWSMGWCHNRVRVVASHFLVKHLLLPWQWGLKHLWDCQIDADLECDALGWQYVSGCLSGGRMSRRGGFV